ncbi:hypothetical protein F4801DRAFT_462631 [Xylaria longipes]|nr:hypothetical protein F4801DRAFT_462631 [Xylaria longipes]
MATSHHRKGSADKMSNEQAAHHHDDEAKTKTNHSMLWPSRVSTWPFRFIKQTLSDYQSGRNMRKRITQEPEHWVHQAGEWPWRIEHVVQWDPSKNFRVLSVLEVNDLYYYAMESERKMKPEDIVVPQTQRPFRVEERDELMDYLTRP